MRCAAGAGRLSTVGRNAAASLPRKSSERTLDITRYEYLNTYLTQNEIEILNSLEPRRWYHVGVVSDSGSLKMKHCGKNMCIERNCCTCCGIKQGWELAMQQATHKNCTLTVTALFQVGRNTIRSSKNLRPEYNI